MTREDITRMAREAGCTPFRSPEYWDDVQVFATPNVLERFAELIAAEEREACASLCKGLAAWHSEIVTAAYETAADAIRARSQE